jgi:hypothetical protein
MLAGSSLPVCRQRRAEQMFRARERPSRRGRLHAAVMPAQGRNSRAVRRTGAGRKAGSGRVVAAVHRRVKVR